MCSNRAVVDRLECCIDDLVECFENFIHKSLMLIFLGIGIIVGLLCYLLKMVLERTPVNDAVVVSEKPIHSRNKANDLISYKKVEQEVNENTLNKLKEKTDMKKDSIDSIITRDNITRDNNITHDNKFTHNNDITFDNDIDKNKTTAAQQQNSIINTSNTPMSANISGNDLNDLSLLSCSKYGCGGSSTHVYVPSRVPIPSLPIASSKHKLIPCLRKRSSNRSSLQSLQICPKMKPGSCCSMCCTDESKRNEDLDIPTSK